MNTNTNTNTNDIINNEMTTPTPEKTFPSNWRIAADFDPNAHLMNLKGRDYMNVQNRLLWFIRDQRDFIAKGLATCSYVIRTELIQHDHAEGYAHFATYVRDVLGNEATMYGSETAKDFPDYAEKASTKSLGRALLVLGYGTAFAPEMDEGERVVDTPMERRQHAPQPRQTVQPQQPVHHHQATTTPDVDSMALTHASALDQKRLYGQLAARKLEANGGFLRNVTGRDIAVEQVRDGRSDLTLNELARVSERLTRMPVATAAASAAAQEATR